MRIASKGQVTIPLEIRATFGLLPNTEVMFEVHHGEVRIRKAVSGQSSRGDAVVATLKKHAPQTKKSTDEIMALMRGDR
jgi:AbrB family looped-hinge helix DNA binding protein